MQDESLRSALRDRTRGLHDRLDATLTGVGGRVVDAADYVRVLRVLHALHTIADAPLARWARTSPLGREIDRSRLPDRAPRYAADLAVLGHEAPQQQGPATDGVTDERGLALLYLVSGSAAGARVLLRGLPDTVPTAARSGLTDAAAPSSTQLWRQTCALLERSTIPELRDAVVAEACAVLELLLDRTELLAS